MIHTHHGYETTHIFHPVNGRRSIAIHPKFSRKSPVVWISYGVGGEEARAGAGAGVGVGERREGKTTSSWASVPEWRSLKKRILTLTFARILNTMVYIRVSDY